MALSLWAPRGLAYDDAMRDVLPARPLLPVVSIVGGDRLAGYDQRPTLLPAASLPSGLDAAVTPCRPPRLRIHPAR